MTLGPRKEHAMKAKPKQQDEPSDVERFRYELALDINRRVAESLEAWTTCENARCRRAQRCAGPDCECIAKWRASLPPLSPEQAKAHLTNFKIALDVRMRLGETVTAEQLSEAIRKEKAARRAAMPLQESDMPAPVVEGTKLAPEKQERINRAGNDCVAEQDRAREPGPRITRL
ncbi:hypothetical protein [Bradyrhizobium sp.]|jgi:hypothetical protein|uniref:hypothetical protein n=1 Tax=Bradyrhizobium sp. TaxID=376 RepID=UPI002E0797A2|nr:hypothetical protein [Bradyrhizobium sp.]